MEFQKPWQSVTDASSEPTSIIPLALPPQWHQQQHQHQYQQQDLSSMSGEPGLQEAMLRATLQPQEGVVPQHPERPGEPDCPYYMRTGLCGFGVNCKFNHPPNLKLVSNRGYFPERPDQPECQYFLKTGTCKFGPSCKYHHPREKTGSEGGTQLNILNFPLRPGEKDCPYYLRTGNCKYGTMCKFNHPPPVMSVPSSPVFPGLHSGAVHVPQFYPGGVTAFPLPRPTFLPSPGYAAGPSSLPPVLVPSAQVSASPWNPYQLPLSFQEGQQQALLGSYIYPAVVPPQEQMAVGLVPPFSPTSGSIRLPSLSTPSTPGPPQDVYPERPGQPECTYYMKTGGCKFGLHCKFHHPRDRNTTIPATFVSPMGLPLRPGAPPCTFFSRFGFCKFGSACKFDHSFMPTAYAYVPSDMPVPHYMMGGVIPSSAAMMPQFSEVSQGQPSRVMLEDDATHRGHHSSF